MGMSPGPQTSGVPPYKPSPLLAYLASLGHWGVSAGRMTMGAQQQPSPLLPPLPSHLSSQPRMTCHCSADRTGVPGRPRAERGSWKQLSLTDCVGSAFE